MGQRGEIRRKKKKGRGGVTINGGKGEGGRKAERKGARKQSMALNDAYVLYCIGLSSY